MQGRWHTARSTSDLLSTAERRALLGFPACAPNCTANTGLLFNRENEPIAATPFAFGIISGYNSVAKRVVGAKVASFRSAALALINN